jgi:hypothetical protein
LGSQGVGEPVWAGAVHPGLRPLDLSGGLVVARGSFWIFDLRDLDHPAGTLPAPAHDPLGRLVGRAGAWVPW